MILGYGAQTRMSGSRNGGWSPCLKRWWTRRFQVFIQICEWYILPTDNVHKVVIQNDIPWWFTIVYVSCSFCFLLLSSTWFHSEFSVDSSFPNLKWVRSSFPRESFIVIPTRRGRFMPVYFFLQVLSIQRSLETNHMADTWPHLTCNCQRPVEVTVASGRWTCRLRGLFEVSIQFSVDRRSTTNGTTNCWKGNWAKATVYILLVCQSEWHRIKFQPIRVTSADSSDCLEYFRWQQYQYPDVSERKEGDKSEILTTFTG